MANVISKSQSIVSKAEILCFDGCGSGKFSVEEGEKGKIKS